MESLQLYHSSFCKALVPFSEEIAPQNTSPDLHVTLIRAFYEGIPNSFANKLRETSCSTWKAAQQNFQECNTRANVQLAVVNASKPTDYHQKRNDQPEGKKALTAINKSTSPPGKTKTPPLVQAEVKSGTALLDTGQPYMGKYCSNCRGQHPTSECTKLPCFVCHEYDEPHTHTQSDCPYRARTKAAKVKAARRRAREIQFLSRHDDSEDSFYTDDFSDH